MEKFLPSPVQLKLNVANGDAVWIAGTPHDLEDYEDTPEVANLMVEAKMNELLKLPFERALQMCPALQRHIETQEDPMDVEDEFRQAWGADGPSDLREALRAVLDPNVALRNKAEAEAIIQEHQSILGENAPKSGGIVFGEVSVKNLVKQNGVVNENGSSFDEPALTERRINARIQESAELQRVVGTIEKMQDYLSGHEINTLERVGKAPQERDAMVHLGSLLNLTLGEGANGPEPKVGIDDLLRKPFNEALESNPVLQKYITEHPDSDSIKQEFKEHWGPDCQALRVIVEVVLGEVPNSEIDSFNSKETNVVQMEIDKNAFLRGEPSPMRSLDGLQMMLSSIDCLENMFNSSDPLESHEDFSVHKANINAGTLTELDTKELRAKLNLHDSGGKDMQNESKDDLAVVHNFSVDELLAQPFETALKLYPALEEYIGDNVDIKEDFRSNWSLDAPSGLRTTLSQLLTQDLLSLNFEEALDVCAALRQYIEVQQVKRASVKDEFANHWGTHAPLQLCSVLQELFDKRGNARADDSDMGNMVSYPPRSRL